jgi:hypothetical protein
LEVLNSILLVAAILAILLAYRKITAIVDRSRLDVKRSIENAVVQLESLLAVHSVLHGTPALSRTRGWAASPDFLAQLANLHQQIQPKYVLECSSGLSSVLLAALMRNQAEGHVFSLEHDPVFAEKTRAMLRQHGLDSWCTVIDAPLHPLELHDWTGKWYSTGDLPADLRAEMLVVDGPPNATGSLARYPALPVLGPKLAENATIVLDDANRPEETETVRRWLTEAPDFVAVAYVPECEKGCSVIRRQVAVAPH